MKTTETGL